MTSERVLVSADSPPGDLVAPTRRVLFVDTHPIAYRGPLIAELATDRRLDVEALYFCDLSVRGHIDRDFGKPVTVDQSVLSGYRYTFQEAGWSNDRNGFFKFRLGSAFHVLTRSRPHRVVLSTLNSAVAWEYLVVSRLMNIPIWLRVETQDHAAPRRKPLKAFIRSTIYRAAYRLIHGAFYIGTRNKEHLLAHGVAQDRLVWTPYTTVDRVAMLADEDKQARRSNLRNRLGIADDVVVGFFGKLIDKKDPRIVVEAMALARDRLPRQATFLIVGSGELRDEIQVAADAQGIRCHFAGLVSQSEIVDYYLATDITVLPSKRAGETWGLVVNEALQAGCAVVVSDAVGSSADLGSLERTQTFPVGDAASLADALVRLAGHPRDFHWSDQLMGTYSIGFCARQMADALAQDTV